MSDTPPTMRPYGRHLIVCTGDQCGSAEQGEAVARRALETLGERRKLRNPERVKCSTASCLGVCQGGPVAVVYPDGVWYHHLDEERIAAIVREHLLADRPVAEAIFHRLYPAGAEPDYAPALRGDLADAALAQNAAAGAQVATEGEADYEPAPFIGEHAESRLIPSDTALHSSDEKKAYRADVRRRKLKKGLVIVNTGNGKGKTSAALGVMTRAWGRGMKVRVIQFLKHENAQFGETRAAARMEIPFGGTGDGFTWTSNDLDATRARALRGWEQAQQAISAGDHQIVILDEFTYLMAFGWLAAESVVAWLREHKPPHLHLIITGRDAPPALIDYADLVTEMREIKHPFKDQGIRAQAGIDF
jgi:cob(I)alamin adenosyltransferase